MKKLMTKVTVLLVGLMAWGMLIAPSSQAATYSDSTRLVCSGGYAWNYVYLVRTPDWWERYVLGQTTTSTYQYRYRVYSMDAFCRGITVY